MKLLQLKCPSCGSKIEVSDALEKFTCNFCGLTTLIDKEILKVEHTIKSGEKDELFKKIDAYVKLGEFKKAEVLCDELKEKYVYDPSIWLFLIQVYTNNFADDCVFDINTIFGYLEKYRKLESDIDLRDKKVEEISKYIYFAKHKNSQKFELYDQEFECPYCGRNIKYGQKECPHCDENLYWPTN